MKEDCWLSILDYAEAHDALAIARHNCKEHDISSECRNVRIVLNDKLSDANSKVLKACEE